MSIVNCEKHGRIIGINACKHLFDELHKNNAAHNMVTIKYEFFPDDPENPYAEHFYCKMCAIKYRIPDGLRITADDMKSDVEPNMYEDAQEELTIVCPKCLDDLLSKQETQMK